MSGNNLVLGLALGYGVEPVWPFVESLRRHYSGPASLLVSTRGPPELFDYLASRNVRAEIFDTAIWMAMHFQVSRYVRYYEILRTPGVRYDRILLTDVSDVFFQGDPFAGAPEGELLFHMEDDSSVIGKDNSNSWWIRDIFGMETVRRLSGRPVSCSGTTIGSQPALLRYIEKLLSYAKPEIMARLGGTRGHDQGIHNYLLHSGELPGITQVPNGEHVHTLGGISVDDMVLSDDGIRTGAGRLCPIVHQYNYNEHSLAWARRHLAYPGSWT